MTDLSKIADTVQYYPHQIEGVREMSRMSSFLLADEMGLGKSLQALTVAAVDFEAGLAKRVIIVCPATLKWNWQAEIEEHTKFVAMVLDGTPKKREAQLAGFDLEHLDVLIVNYEQVEPHLAALNAMNFDIAIFDEAHYIKSRRAKRTKAAQALRAKRRFLLTGSPLLNQIDELWSLLYRIDPEGFPSYHRFVNRYAVFGGYKDKQVVGIKNARELNSRLSSLMIRREKAKVLDLPEKQHIRVMLELLPEQVKLYKQARDEMRIDIPSSLDPMEIENALTKMLRLKQIIGTTATIAEEDHSSKLDYAEELVDEVIASGEHVVVFTQFREVLACLERRLVARGLRVFTMTGDTPTNKRVEVVNEWSASKPAALVAMLQVASVGLNMTKASKCVFLDKLWTPKLNEQAEDRLHRIGADGTKPIQIFELVCRGTIEARIEAILKTKRELFGAVVEESEWKRRLIESLADDE